MGFWSALGALGGLAAAPFTGGASMIPMLTGIGGAVGGIGDAIQQANQSPAGAIGQEAGNIEAGRLNAAGQQAKLQMEGNASALSAPEALAKNAVRGDILANAKDATISGLPSYITVPQINGGLRPSLFSAATRNLGSQMSGDALKEYQSGDYTNPAQFLPQSSAFDKVLQGTALAGGFLNASRGLLPKIAGAGDSGVQLPPDWQPTGPPDPTDPWNGDPALLGGG